MKKTAICLLLALVTVFAVACNKGGGPGGDTPEDPDAQYHRIVEDSGEKVWSAGAQVIVLPTARGSLVDEAAVEFSRIFKMATDLPVELEYEADVTSLDPDNYYYFIGKTDALAEEGIDISYDLLGDSGVNIQTRGNVTYMSGATDKGTLYSVYEYMNRAYGYEFYAAGEEYTDDGTDANWMVFDYIYRPSVANPCMMSGELNADSSLYYKYRFQNYYETWVADASNNVYYAHTYFQILDPDIYYEDHKDWYSPDDKHQNLCLTRDPAMIDEFVARCKQILTEDEGRHKYFMLGQQDNFEFCECASCKQRTEELGGFVSAVVLEFSNEVVSRLNEWLEEEYPGREVIFVIFAYNATKEPPVKWNEAEQKWEPISEHLRTVKNLSVQYVPNLCDYYDPYTESFVGDHVEGWAVMTDILTIWEYSTNFDNYLDCFHNFRSMAENLRLFEKHGVDYIVEQSSYSTPTSAFSELRLYLWSKLMWDCTLDTDTLIADFMQHYYYKDAAEDVTAYFNAIYGHVDELAEQYGVTVRSNGNECMNKNYWRYTDLDPIKKCIDGAFTAIEPLKTSDPELYETLYDRVDKQALWVDYWIGTWYEMYVGDIDEYMKDWVSRARSHGITMYGEGVYI